jgi:lysophospholipid acyltransferase (LPLAT)-like uncharacterized protein
MEPQPIAQAAPTEAERESVSRSFSLRQRLLLWVISWMGYLFIRVIGLTLRYTIVREPECVSDGWTAPPSIWCFWHRCIPQLAGVLSRRDARRRSRGRQFTVMVSRSFDGEYIARIAQKLGFRTVRGSSSRGAVGALMGMRRELENGHLAGFTIDGPRGPRYVAKPGPILLAKMTGYSVNCFYIAVQRAWVLNSWDRMTIPKPFSHACGYFSGPLNVPADATESEMEALHRQMQTTLERCQREAEARVPETA